LAARETVAEEDDRQGGTYRLELVRCGKDRCTRCAEGPAHGPYWYRYYRRGGKVVSRYVGKTLPAADAGSLADRGDTGGAPDAGTAAAAGTGQAPAALEERIRGAYRALAGEPGDFVWLSDLRGQLPGVAPRELDAALVRMYAGQEINLVPSADQHPRVLTDARRAAAVHVGMKDKHRVSIEVLHKTAVT
jgi:hypothetical protein